MDKCFSLLHVNAFCKIFQSDNNIELYTYLKDKRKIINRILEVEYLTISQYPKLTLYWIGKVKHTFLFSVSKSQELHLILASFMYIGLTRGTFLPEIMALEMTFTTIVTLVKNNLSLHSALMRFCA